jgi:hypothetical protein
MDPLGPGTYLVRRNANGKPSLYTSDGTPIQNPIFQTIGDAVLTFEIENDNNLRDGFIFTASPLSWSDGAEPIGNQFVRNGNTSLVLNVRPPLAQRLTVTYHFQLHFNSGEIEDVLWSDDGGTVLDPTIIEKPPEDPGPGGDGDGNPY